MVYPHTIQPHRMIWKGSCKPQDLPETVAREMSEAQREVTGYWYSLKPAEGLPARSRFDPLEVWTRVASITLLQVLGDGEDIVFRLVGQDFADRAGSNLRGQRFTKVGNPDEVPQIQAALKDMLRDPRPVLHAGTLSTFDRGHVGYRRLAVGFAEQDGGPLAHILCCYAFES
ncbi:PAS domain-containing protein [Fodinicurvata sediminis]|uniref:PAS domain-containing protein n=1 Tax=Fodinicurvata sediminis TaxID=1121832 RepID=UPI0003B73C90|nr:PAS domain-containing protein [Fodinicurvata sediminis]